MMRAASRYFVDLSQHLAECDTNYLRLCKLMPEMLRGNHRDIGLAFGNDHLQLSIAVEQRAPYTTTLRLRQSRAVWGDQAPEMTVRVYHDARMAEVIDYQKVRVARAHYDYPNPRMHTPDEKRQLNRLLGEWLSLCLVHGHETEPVVV